MSISPESERPTPRPHAAGADPAVLLVDDDGELREIVRTALQREGDFTVTEAAEGPAALEMLRTRPADLVVLDLALPGMSGLDVLREIRSRVEVPVIILSGRGDETDRVMGLELGADDYMVKPFSTRELIARIRNVLGRWAAPRRPQQLVFDGLVIDTAAREVAVHDHVADLTTREFDLLVFLASSPRQVFSPEQLLRQVWHAEPGWQSASTVSEHVYRIRRKLQQAGLEREPITTVRGAGYRFEP